MALSDPPGQPQDALSEEAVKRDVLWTAFLVCRRVQDGQVTLYARPGSC
ncbi:hypothetical protein ACWD6R_34325 [Streptomyces sp. NPDC005151]